jgi:PLP dependent protein
MDIAHALGLINERIGAACARGGRAPSAVTLVAVSKAQPAAAVAQAAAAGQRAFGENYVQEALVKIEKLRGSDLVWHFIGPIQSNKTRDIAENFAWAHGVDRLKIAQRLSDQRPDTLPPLNVCVQINISEEDSKSGVVPAQAGTLCHEVMQLPRLKLRGLMAIPAPGDSAALRRMHELFERLRGQGLALDTLSMGMSDDFEAAIAEGATLVRVGSAIFGQRA